jgi:hypothetical protein
MATQPTDFTLEDEGSLSLLKPETTAAQDWVNEHISPDHQVWGDAIVIEPGYVWDVINGILDDGFTINA